MGSTGTSTMLIHNSPSMIKTPSVPSIEHDGSCWTCITRGAYCDKGLPGTAQKTTFQLGLTEQTARHAPRADLSVKDTRRDCIGTRPWEKSRGLHGVLALPPIRMEQTGYAVPPRVNTYGTSSSPDIVLSLHRGQLLLTGQNDGHRCSLITSPRTPSLPLRQHRLNDTIYDTS